VATEPRSVVSGRTIEEIAAGRVQHERTAAEAKDPVEMGEFICPICGRQYPTLEELHAHVRRAHRHHPRVR